MPRTNMVPADMTGRRNLIMVNPIEGNSYALHAPSVAAYQCVMAATARARTAIPPMRAAGAQGKPGIATICERHVRST